MTPSAVAPWVAPPVGTLPGLEFAPGTNADGELASADWRFLLPHIRVGTVLFLGAPPAAVAAALARTTDRVLVVDSQPLALERVRVDARSRGIGNVHPLCAALPGRLPCGDGTVELVVPYGRQVTARLLADPGFAGELARVLAPDGTVYLEVHGHLDALAARRWGARLRERGFEAPRTYWLVPRRPAGLRLAVPLEQAGAVRHAFDQVLHGTSRRAAVLRALGRVAARTGLYALLVPSRALVVQRLAAPGAAPSGERDTAAPVRWVAALGARAGIDAARLRPAVFARGTYDSNKVALFLFDGPAAEPAVLLKVTRAPRYNHRLEAEHRALEALRARGLADAGTYPEALFLDHHDDLAVLAQRVVRGVPFRTRTRGGADCPLARAAVAWIEELGARSAGHAEGAGAVRATLAGVLERFEAIYTLPDDERTYLRERLATLGARLDPVLGATPRPIPTVFQHGDAGTWNVLATGRERVAFLDWEVSSARGVPLWDLLDFLRSYGSWAARRRGEGSMARAYATYFLAPTPLAELQAAAVRRYCARVGVPGESIEALFLGCWMQRAVREAAWTSRPLAEGAYVQLLRTCVRGRYAEGLRWLFD